MKMQRRGEHAHEKARRRGEHADRVEGARKVRKDGIRRRVLNVRTERRGELALEPPHTFPPGSHEHTATQKAERTTPGPEPGARGCHVLDEGRRIRSAAVDAAEKVALRVRDRNLLGCGQRGQDSVGVLAYVEQLPFGGQARAVQECAEGPGCACALEVQRVPVGRGDGGAVVSTCMRSRALSKCISYVFPQRVSVACCSPVASQVPMVPSSEGVVPGTYLREGGRSSGVIETSRECASIGRLDRAVGGRRIGHICEPAAKEVKGGGG